MTQIPAAEWAGRWNGEPRVPAPWPSGISFAVAVGCCAPAALVAWLAGAGTHPLAGVALFAGLAAALAAVSGGLGAAAAGLLMWATEDGFVIHRFGVLSADAGSVRALAVIGCAAAGAYGMASLARWLLPPLDAKQRKSQRTNR